MRNPMDFQEIIRIGTAGTSFLPSSSFCTFIRGGLFGRKTSFPGAAKGDGILISWVYGVYPGT